MFQLPRFCYARDKYLRGLYFLDKFLAENHDVGIVPKSRTSRNQLLLLTSVISFSGAAFAVLEEVREGKVCPFHICCTDKQPNVPFG